MEIKTIYHGSGVVVEKPDISKSRPDTDYGIGFYCTEDENLAKEWACNEGHSGYSNRYEIDISMLHILNLNSDGYSPLNWIALLLKNRSFRIRAPIQRRGIRWLLNNCLIDIAEYDVIIGHRADDSYTAIVEMFLMNTITIEQLTRALNLGDWGDQFVLKSPKAYGAIRFMDAVPADHTYYYPKRKRRDENARLRFLNMLDETDINGTYLKDIIS